MSDDTKIISLEGPVDLIDGKLTLVIALDVGGWDLYKCCKGIAEIRGENLMITIPDFIAAKLTITEESFVVVDNQNGKLNIRKKPAN
jgi:hypothetical protein